MEGTERGHDAGLAVGDRFVCRVRLRVYVVTDCLVFVLFCFFELSMMRSFEGFLYYYCTVQVNLG